MKRKLFFIFLGFWASLVIINYALAQYQPKEVKIYFFYGKGCPHCVKEEEFLKWAGHQYPTVKVLDFELYYHLENVKLAQEVQAALNIKSAAVPFTVIGDKYFIGFAEKSTPSALQQQIEYCLQADCPDIMQKVEARRQIAAPAIPPPSNDMPNSIRLPFVGEIAPASLSLPILTVILGLLDGFNPCAMWALIFLISLLLGMKNQRRMWILGSAFIAVSATVYFVFMTAWLNLFLLVGFLPWIRLAVAAVALWGGAYGLRSFWKEKDGTCPVTQPKKRQQFFQKLKLYIQTEQFWLALGGIILLAAAVNLVELLCSIGLPMIYTQVLTLSNLPPWAYYLYILGYLFFFMLDDVIIFVIAMVTLRLTGLNTKYSRYSHLISGVIMTILGLMLIFRPNWLIFR